MDAFLPRGLTRRGALLAAGALALGAFASPAAAAPPLEGGPLRIVVGYAPGGATDLAARIIAERLKDRLGVPVLVENRPGAGGRLSAREVRGAPADQNVLLLGNPALMVVAPLVFKDNGYDPQRDFVPVGHLTNYEFAVAVGTAVPVRELSHLVAWMRANPEKVAFGVPATGSLPHFFALMLGEKIGVDPQVVGYRGSAPLMTDVIGGHVPIAVDTFETIEPQHRAGKLRILSVSSARRSPLSPDIPTFRESGIELAASGWNVLFAPTTLPAARRARIAAAVHEAMSEPETQAKYAAAKLQPVAATAEQTARMLDAYRAQWAPVVQRSGFQP